MYSKLLPVRPVAKTPSGQSFADPWGWTDKCVSGTGTVSVMVGYDWNTDETQNAYYAVSLTAETEYTFSGVATYSRAKVDVYNAAGTKVAYNTGFFDENNDYTWTMPDCTFTPGTTGIYIVMFSNGSEMGDGQETYAFSISPRPSTLSKSGFSPWHTSIGLDSMGAPIRSKSAGAVGLSGLTDASAWLMLSLDGNTADTSKTGRTNVTTDGSYVSGKIGNALLLNGASLAIPYTDNPFTGDFTIQAWVKANSSARACLMALADDQYIGIDNNAGTWNMWAGSGSWSILQADTDDSDPTGSSGFGTIPIVTGEWAHVAYVRYGNIWTIYVNGVVSRSKTRTGSISYTNKTIRLGKWGGDIFGADIVVDSFRIDTRALWTGEFTPPTT